MPFPHGGANGVWLDSVGTQKSQIRDLVGDIETRLEAGEASIATSQADIVALQQVPQVRVMRTTSLSATLSDADGPGQTRMVVAPAGAESFVNLTAGDYLVEVIAQARIAVAGTAGSSFSAAAFLEPQSLAGSAIASSDAVFYGGNASADFYFPDASSLNFTVQAVTQRYITLAAAQDVYFSMRYSVTNTTDPAQDIEITTESPIRITRIEVVT